MNSHAKTSIKIKLMITNRIHQPDFLTINQQKIHFMPQHFSTISNRFDKKKHWSIQYVCVEINVYVSQKKDFLMMQHQMTVVLAGTAAHFLTGWVLNSDMLLGKVWKQEKKAHENLSKDMRLNIAAQLAASMALTVATCVAIAVCDKAQVATVAKTALERVANMFFGQEHAPKSMMHSMHTVLFVWAGFLLPISAEEVIWCGKSMKHWALEAMSQLVSLMAVAVTVTYLS